MIRPFLKTTCIAALIALALSACGGGLKLAEISDNPSKYNDKQVTVRGKVVQTYAVPVLNQSVVQIDDGSGTIWVKPQGRVPFEGEKIKVKGTVKIGLTLANYNLGVIVIENEKK